MDLTTCPACGGPAEVLWRETWPSTEGPVEHAKIGCVRRHWFLLPADQLASAPGPGASVPVVVHVDVAAGLLVARGPVARARRVVGARRCGLGRRAVAAHR